VDLLELLSQHGVAKEWNPPSEFRAELLKEQQVLYPLSAGDARVVRQFVGVARVNEKEK